jgi:small ligand-binding sensory domain FIST
MTPGQAPRALPAMQAFRVAHATHPDWRAALALVKAQLSGGASASAPTPTLGFVYITDVYAPHAMALMAALHEAWPTTAFVGSVGVGICATGVEYHDEGALVLMLAALPRAQFEVFSGAQPLQRVAPFTALVHADPATPDVDELVAEMSRRTLSGYLFGGLASSRQQALHLAEGVWRGGLSGVAFAREVQLVSRVTQGCQPIGPARQVTACERNIAIELDGQPALPLLLQDLGVQDLDDHRRVLPLLRATLAGITSAGEGQAQHRQRGQFGPDTRVRHLVGLDPGRRAVAVGDLLEPGMSLAFCQRDVNAARRDLVRICAEVREEVEGAEPPQRMVGALYVSCSGRGGAHFGGDSAELQIVQHALGDVPLAGFFAAGEVARHHLYGYTGVLTVFVAGA